MKMTRFLSTVFSITLLIFSLLSQAESAFAQITIRSQVSIRPAHMGDLSLTNFTDNLGTSDAHFMGDESIIFKVMVTNNGPEKVTDITVVDTIPNYLEAHRPTLIGWNPNTRTVTYQIPFIHPGHTNDTFVPMKVIENEALPGAPQTYCLTNNVRFTAPGSTGSDSSTFCVEKVPPINLSSPTTAPTTAPRVTQAPQPTVTPTTQPDRPSPTPTMGPTNVTQVPSTGPEAGILVFGGQILTLIAGIAIKRRVS